MLVNFIVLLSVINSFTIISIKIIFNCFYKQMLAVHSEVTFIFLITNPIQIVMKLQTTSKTVVGEVKTLAVGNKES